MKQEKKIQYLSKRLKALPLPKLQLYNTIYTHQFKLMLYAISKEKLGSSSFSCSMFYNFVEKPFSLFTGTQEYVQPLAGK